LNVLGEIARAEGRYDLAKGFNLEGLALARELGSNIEIAIATRNVGDIALRDGNLDSAKSLFAESLALAREFDLKPRMTFALLVLLCHLIEFRVIWGHGKSQSYSPSPDRPDAGTGRVSRPVSGAL
jgi:hypothetical protein